VHGLPNGISFCCCAIAALRTEIASTGRAIEEREAQVLEITRDYRQDRD